MDKAIKDYQQPKLRTPERRKAIIDSLWVFLSSLVTFESGLFQNSEIMELANRIKSNVLEFYEISLAYEMTGKEYLESSTGIKLSDILDNDETSEFHIWSKKRGDLSRSILDVSKSIDQDCQKLFQLFTEEQKRAMIDATKET
ncbi:MAG: hypothetical protein RIC35_20815 [Marinoscillum sp.]